MNKVVVKFKDGRASVTLLNVRQVNSILGRTLLFQGTGKPIPFTHSEVDEIKWLFDNEKPKLRPLTVIT